MKHRQHNRLPFNLGFLIMWILFTVNTVYAQTWPSGAHDPSSMIKDGNTYWEFATGNGIYAKYSTDMVTWSDGPTPFPIGEFPNWILNYAKTTTDQFAGNFWAPDIIYMNNKYYLYYSCSVWGTMNSCIGCVTNKTLNPDSPDYKWEDQGDLGIYSPDFSIANTGWDVNAIDPALMRAPDGKIWMVYGSFNKGGIMVTQIDSVSGKPFGPRTSIANSWTGPRQNDYAEGEGGCMFYRKGYYYLVYNKGGCCNGIASTYYMVIGRSQNPTGPFIDKSGKNMRVIGAKSGGTTFFRHDNIRGLNDRYFGPGHFGIYRENSTDYVSFHYYAPNGYYPSADANYMGGPTLGLGFLKWGDDGWPYLSFDFIEDGVYSVMNSNSKMAMGMWTHPVTKTTLLYQLPEDSTDASQRWLFTSLGTGEYTIKNYADDDLYLDAGGADNNQTLGLTSSYDSKINQKFRLVKDADNQIIMYPSTKDNIFSVPYDAETKYQVSLIPNENKAGQRWSFYPDNITFSVFANNMELNFNDTTFNSIMISGNSLWDVKFEDASWLEATPQSGKGDTVLSVHAFANETNSVRTNKIFIHSHSGITGTVLVKQAANSKPTAVSNQAAIDQIMIYPNPTNGKVYIETANEVTVEVYNSIGTRLFSKEIKDSKSAIDLRNFVPGLYIVEINTNGIRYNRMVIKK